MCSGLTGSFSSQITFSLAPERIARIHRHFFDWEMDIPPPASNRASRFMIEGVGTRVIRGPDWKWGKQVSHRKKQDITDCSFHTLSMSYIFY